MKHPHRLKLEPCPYCGGHLDAAASAEGDDVMPRPGDPSICFHCGEWLIFGEDLKLRKPTDDEHIEIGLDPECRLVRQAWASMNRERTPDGAP